jgi:hypothetical protein
MSRPKVEDAKSQSLTDGGDGEPPTQTTTREPVQPEALRIHGTDPLFSISNMARLQGMESADAGDEAERLIREALEAQREARGDHHPLALAYVNNLASLLMSRGKLTEAETLLRELLGARRETLGDRHPSTLDSISDLGMLLQELGKLTEADSRRTGAAAQTEDNPLLKEASALMTEAREGRRWAGASETRSKGRLGPTSSARLRKVVTVKELKNKELEELGVYKDANLAESSKTDLGISGMRDWSEACTIGHIFGMVDLTDVVHLRKIFDDIDTDKSGTIETSELAAALKKAGKYPTDEQVKELLETFDEDKNGSLSFDEFQKMLQDWDSVIA